MESEMTTRQIVAGLERLGQICTRDDDALLQAAADRLVALDTQLAAAIARAEKAKALYAATTKIRPFSEWTDDDGDVVWWRLEQADGSMDAEAVYWGSPLCAGAPADEMVWWSYGPNFNQWYDAARKEAGL